MARVATSGRVAINRNPVTNGGFETAPVFVAATTTLARWIDGTAAGSTTSDNYRWANRTGAGSTETRFDSTTSVTGSNSLKMSLVGTNSRLTVNNTLAATVAGMNRWGIRAVPSTPYILTYWMKTNYVSGDSNGIRMQVIHRSATASTLTTTSSSFIKTTTDWTQYSLSFTSNASAAFFEIQMDMAGQAGAATLVMDAWFDDIRLIPGAAGRVAVSGRVSP